jgi:hypothetical protein
MEKKIVTLNTINQTCGGNFHDQIIALRREAWVNETTLTLPFLLRGQVLYLCVTSIDFASFLWVFYWILEHAIFFSILLYKWIISWRSVLLMEETGLSGESHPPVASHWKTLSHNVISSSLCLSGVRTQNV